MNSLSLKNKKNNFNLNKANSGAYGRYLSRKNIGYKFLGKGYRSKKLCLKSYDLTSATKEAAYLILAETTKISPRFISLEIIEYKKRFYPVIVMEHFKGKTLFKEKNGNADIFSLRVKNKKLLNHKNNGTIISNFIQNRLNKLMIEHKDIHTKNIIICPNKEVKVIDFGPREISYKGNKKSYKDAYKKAKSSLDLNVSK